MRINTLLAAFAATGALWIMGCAGTARSLDDVWDKMTIEDGSLEEYAPCFIGRYDAVVERMGPESFYYLTRMLAYHGPLYAAVHLEPFLARTEGPKRAAVAAALAWLSHGNHEEAMRQVRHACGDPDPKVKKMATYVLFEVITPAFRATSKIEDALECGVLPGDWMATGADERWSIIKRRVADGGGRRLEGPRGRAFYLCVATQVDEDNWLELGRLCLAQGPDSAAVYLSPLVLYLEGDRQILVASLAALFSHGNSPRAMAALEKARYEAKSAKVLQILVSVERFLEVAREHLDTADSERARLTLDRWQAMSLAERWEEGWYGEYTRMAAPL